jgi:hypothetical protein
MESFMEKTDDMPLWVYLAFSSIATRTGALWLIWICVLFTLYCVPWPRYFPDQTWVATLCLIKGWSWFAMMLPMTLWYGISLRWMDKNAKWAPKEVAPPE